MLVKPRCRGPWMIFGDSPEIVAGSLAVRVRQQKAMAANKVPTPAAPAAAKNDGER